MDQVKLKLGGGVSSRRERFIEFGGPNGGNGGGNMVFVSDTNLNTCLIFVIGDS